MIFSKENHELRTQMYTHMHDQRDVGIKKIAPALFPSYDVFMRYYIYIMFT